MRNTDMGIVTMRLVFLVLMAPGSGARADARRFENTFFQMLILQLR